MRTILERFEPREVFPYVGPPGNRLYRVGLCKICSLLLVDDKPVAREYCYWHDPGSIGKSLSLFPSEEEGSPGVISEQSSDASGEPAKSGGTK